MTPAKTCTLMKPSTPDFLKLRPIASANVYGSANVRIERDIAKYQVLESRASLRPSEIGSHLPAGVSFKPKIDTAMTTKLAHKRLGNMPSKAYTIKPPYDLPPNIQMKNVIRAEKNVPSMVTLIVPNLSHAKPISGRPIPVDTNRAKALASWVKRHNKEKIPRTVEHGRRERALLC